MKNTYRILETAVYEVEAESPEEAEEIFTDSDDINEFFRHVEDRVVIKIRKP